MFCRKGDFLWRKALVKGLSFTIKKPGDIVQGRHDAQHTLEPGQVQKAAADRKAECVDSPGWENGKGMSCARYGTLGYCMNGSAIIGKEWSTGSAFNFPERNCCECGKLTAAKVSALRLDSVVNEDVLLWHLDTEGFEPRVLASAEAILSTKRVQNVIAEFRPSRYANTGTTAGEAQQIYSRFVKLKKKQDIKI